MSDSAEAQPYKYNGPIVTMLRSFDDMRFKDAANQLGPALKGLGVDTVNFAKDHPVLATGGAMAVAAVAAIAVDPQIGSAATNAASNVYDYLSAPVPEYTSRFGEYVCNGLGLATLGAASLLLVGSVASAAITAFTPDAAAPANNVTTQKPRVPKSSV